MTPATNPNRSRSFGSRWPLSRLRGFIALIAFPLAAFAQGTGTISGRVFNPTTGEYIRNAEVRIPGTQIAATTDTGGYYTLHNVPAGEVTVTVNYTGFESAPQVLNVASGSIATRDFELKGLASTRRADDVVQLGQFVVATEREGNAKAIMDQKAAMNVKTVVATDSFGDIAEGNIGEFLKFMPGITLDYVETDTRAARMGGLEARYGAVTLDGNSVANTSTGSFGGNTRQFEFEAMSINNIESIEVNKTLNADMQADAPAGTVNLRTKSALARKGQRFNFNFGFIGNQYEHSFSQTPRHDDAEHAKSRPTYAFDYVNTFNEKLGITLNASSTSVFKEQFRHTLSYDYTSPEAVRAGTPLITQINFKDGPKMTDKHSAGLKVEYEPIKPLLITLASSYIWFSDEIANRNLGFRVNSAQLGAGSSMLRVVANPVAGNGTRVNQDGGHGNKQTDTTNLALGFVYKGPNYTLDAQSSYSRARQQNGSDHMAAVGTANTQLTRISYTAERPSVGSTDWTFTQLTGPDWFNWENYGRNFDAVNGNISGSRSRSKTQQFVNQVNLKYVTPWRVPTFFKIGLFDQLSVRDREQKTAMTSTWVGPTGNQLTSSMPTSIASFRISQPFGGNIYALPVPDKSQIFALLKSNPGYFTQTEAQQADNLNTLLGSNQDVEEQIRAGYIMGNTSLGKWQFQAGVRYETTETTATINKRLPDADNPFSVPSPTNPTMLVAPNPLTLNFVRARWSQGRETASGDYDDFFPSASAVYRITPSLIAKFGFHKAIQRPPLDALAGQWEIDEAAARISVPSPDLKPERSDKVSAILEYYFEPASTVSVHVFQNRLKGALERSPWLSAEEFGFGDDPVLRDYEFRGWFNVPGTRRVKGIEFNYSQQLAFFRNELLRGTRIFATYSRFTSTPRPNEFIPQNATGGINVRFRDFNASIAGTWTDDSYTGGNTVTATAAYFGGDREVLKERFIFDVGFGYKISRRLEFYISGRNAFNSGKTWFFKNTNGRIRQVEKYGGQWTVGVKGNF